MDNRKSFNKIESNIKILKECSPETENPKAVTQWERIAGDWIVDEIESFNFQTLGPNGARLKCWTCWVKNENVKYWLVIQWNEWIPQNDASQPILSQVTLEYYYYYFLYILIFNIYNIFLIFIIYIGKRLAVINCFSQTL
jgi:hypothetical protein